MIEIKTLFIQRRQQRCFPGRGQPIILFLLALLLLASMLLRRLRFEHPQLGFLYRLTQNIQVRFNLFIGLHVAIRN